MDFLTVKNPLPIIIAPPYPNFDSYSALLDVNDDEFIIKVPLFALYIAPAQPAVFCPNEELLTTKLVFPPEYIAPPVPKVSDMECSV